MPKKKFDHTTDDVSLGDVSLGGIHIDGAAAAAVIDAASRQETPEGFSTIATPVVEETVADATVPDAKPEGWDDPWYWEGVSDQYKPDEYSPAQEAVMELGSYYKFGDSHGYHFSSGASGYAHVETEVIRACAESGRNTLGQIKELIQTMVTYVSASEEYWKGDTGNDFREGFIDGMKGLSHDLENLAPYVRELIAYADKYDEVITEANVIAEGIGDIVWQDV